MVADDPRPVEFRGEFGEQRSGLVGQSVAAECIVKAVAEAEQPPGAGAPDLGRKRAQRRVRIVGREELAEPREPARFLEVKVGDQQRVFTRPKQRALSGREERFTGERKGNHETAVTAGSSSR